MQDPSTNTQPSKRLLAMAMILGGILMVVAGIALWWSVAEPTLKPKLSVYLMGLGTTTLVLGIYAMWESRQPFPDDMGPRTPLRTVGHKSIRGALPEAGRPATLAG